MRGHGLDRVNIPPGERTASVPRGLLPFFADDSLKKDIGKRGCQASHQNWCNFNAAFSDSGTHPESFPYGFDDPGGL